MVRVIEASHGGVDPPVLLLQHKIVIALRAVSGKFFANHSFDGEWRKDSRSCFGYLALLAFAPQKDKKNDPLPTFPDLSRLRLGVCTVLL